MLTVIAWYNFCLRGVKISEKLKTSTAPICTGLKTEWTSKIKTTTQFPVDPGTVVEVTCSNPDAVIKGSNRITCTIGTDFTHSKEPSCSIPGKQHYNYTVCLQVSRGWGE